VSIGPDADAVRGVRSRGYTIRRSGTSVVVKYGSVEVSGGGGGRYQWVGAFPRVVVHRFRSATSAIEFLQRQVRSKENRDYERLPGRVKIRRSRKSDS
jgi:hypothetical protein